MLTLPFANILIVSICICILYARGFNRGYKTENQINKQRKMSEQNKEWRIIGCRSTLYN